MVEVFGDPSSLPGIVDEVLVLNHRPDVLLAQIGVVHEQAARHAEDAGLKVVIDRSPACEYPRLIGT